MLKMREPVSYAARTPLDSTPQKRTGCLVKDDHLRVFHERARERHQRALRGLGMPSANTERHSRGQTHLADRQIRALVLNHGVQTEPVHRRVRAAGRVVAVRRRRHRLHVLDEVRAPKRVPQRRVVVRVERVEIRPQCARDCIVFYFCQ